MKKLVLIGASTGGPSHIKTLVKDLNLHDASVVIAQHMQANYIHRYAEQLSTECKSSVKLLEGACFLENKIYICQHNTQIGVNLRASINDAKFAFTPNVNLLFSSAAKNARGVQIMAILLTGIGDDGASGMLELFNAGAKCIAESEKSCIVYGMPKRAFELNNRLLQLDLLDIRRELMSFLA